MSSTSTDRIEKKINLSAPLSRVWRAISDAQEFGAWFRLALEGPLVAGHTVHGQLTHPGYEHLRLELRVVEITPERYLSYRWHPHATDPDHDYSNEAMTLVEFELEASPSGTLLTIVESGFDGIPLERRALAFRSNDGGWSQQLLNIERHVSS